MKKAVFYIDVFEDWFVDLPETVSPSRTRDYRYYAERFASSAYTLTRASQSISDEVLRELAQSASFVTVATSGCFDGRREQILVDQFDAIQQLAAEHPGVFNTLMWGESETHIYRELPPSATPRDAYRQYKKACFEYGAGCRGDTVRHCLDDIEQYDVRDFFEAVYGGKAAAGFEILTDPDKVWGIHPHLEWGADGIIFERSGWNDNFQVAIAFLRGASRQYDKPWTIEISPWGGSHTYGRGPTTYDQEGRHVTGITASLTFFAWVSAMVSGSALVRQQAQECTLFGLRNPTIGGSSNCDTSGGSMPIGDSFRKQDPGTTGAELSPVGEYAVRLAELNRRPDFDIGESITPVAIMVELWHGWDASVYIDDNCVWGGSVPLARGDRMMYELFEVFFPGYRKAGRMTDPTFNPSLPFSNEREMMAMLADGMDMRPFESGIFVPSPLGDSFDVVTDGIDDRKLAGYPMVILGGRLSLSPANLGRFKKYVQQGGRLFLHTQGIGYATGDDEYQKELRDFLGVEWVSEYAQGFSKTTMVTSGRAFDEVRYEYTRVRLEGARAVAMNGQDDPLVTRNEFGKGEVYLGTAHHHLSLTGKSMLKGVAAALEACIEPLLPVRIEGQPVEYQVNKTENGHLVAVYNWNSTPWTGDVILNRSVKGDKVVELFSDREIAFDKDASDDRFTANVAPYDICLYAL